MSHISTYDMPFARRKREKTNYKKRLALLKSKMPRLVVRKSNNRTITQLVEYKRKGDLTIASANSGELKKYGWTGHKGNLPSAYLTGLLCGTRAGKKEVTGAIFDMGLATPVHGSRVFAALKGAVDAGIKIKCNEEIFPKDERISGKHINEETASAFEKTKSNITKENGEKK